MFAVPTDLQCALHKKEMECVSYICLDSDCKENLLCGLCLRKHQQDHEVVNFKRFLCYAQEILYDQTFQNKRQTLKKRKIIFLRDFEKYRDEINKSLDFIQNAIDDYFDGTNARLTAGLLQEKAIPFSLPTITNNVNLDDIRQIRQNFFEKKEIRSNIENYFYETNIIQTNVLEKMQTAFQYILIEMDGFLDLLQSITEIPPVKLSEQNDTITASQPLNWSNELKHLDISLQENKIQRETAIVEWSQENKIQRETAMVEWSVCCLGNKIMSDDDEGLSEWSIKIDSLEYWMCVGICDVQRAGGNKFEEAVWRETGHGHYCVSTSGEIFSHSDQNVNDKLNPFVFKAGDQLHFSYDRKQGILKVIKYDDNVTITISIEVEQYKGKKYSVCAYLYDVGDALTIS